MFREADATERRSRRTCAERDPIVKRVERVVLVEEHIFPYELRIGEKRVRLSRDCRTLTISYTYARSPITLASLHPCTAGIERTFWNWRALALDLLLNWID